MNIGILGICEFEKWSSISGTSEIGGIAGVIKSILPYLKGEKVYLLGTTSEKVNLHKEVFLTKRIISFPIIYIPKSTILPERLSTFFKSRNINSILKDLKITSVYAHSEEMLYWVNPSMNSIYHMHGSTNALAKAKNPYLRNKIFQNLWSGIRRKCLNNSTHIIAIDHLCLEIAKNTRADNKAILLPNFVDTSIFYFDKSKSKDLQHINEKIILFVGRIEEVKGLELFVDIVEHLNRKENGMWKGVFVGKGSYLETINNYIKENSHDKLFHFMGAVYDQNELRKIYNQAHCLIISSFFEGIPMVVLESLACGTGIFSTNVGGLKELISNEPNCYIIDSRDPLLFADTILENQNNKKVVNDNFKYSVEKISITLNKLLLTR